MRIAILMITLLISVSGLTYAEMDQSCYNRCAAQSQYKTANDLAYCEMKCSGNEEAYPKQQLELQKQQIDLQKQTLDIQKQSLELQKQQIELLKQQQEQLRQQTKQTEEIKP